MKKIRLTLLLCTMSLMSGAQNRFVEQSMRDFVLSPGITTSQSIIRERDLSQTGNPMKSMCEVWEFTCDASMASRIEQLYMQMTTSSSSEQCYYVKTHTPGSADWHDILVGDDPNRLVELGRSERCHYTIVNFIDTLDETKSHRYAYALEWQEQNIPFKLKEQNGKLVKMPATEKTLKGKVVMTYARIPQPKQQQENVKEYRATISHFKNGELLESLKKKLKETDITELVKSMEQWIDAALEEDDE